MAKGKRVSSIVKTNVEDVEDKKEKDKELGDIWWEALESKTHIEEDILEELVIGKPKEADIVCGCVVRNFWNCSTREATVALGDNVGPNPNKLDGGTTVVVLDYKSLLNCCWIVLNWLYWIYI